MIIIILQKFKIPLNYRNLGNSIKHNINLISAIANWFFKKLGFLYKKKQSRINQLKIFVEGMSILGFAQQSEYYEICDFMTDNEKSQVDELQNRIKEKYQSKHKQSKQDFENAASSNTDPLRNTEMIKNAIYDCVVQESLEELAKLKEIMMQAILREEQK